MIQDEKEYPGQGGAWEDYSYHFNEDEALENRNKTPEEKEADAWYEKGAYLKQQIEDIDDILQKYEASPEEYKQHEMSQNIFPYLKAARERYAKEYDEWRREEDFFQGLWNGDTGNATNEDVIKWAGNNLEKIADTVKNEARSDMIHRNIRENPKLAKELLQSQNVISYKFNPEEFEALNPNIINGVKDMFQ